MLTSSRGPDIPPRLLPVDLALLGFLGLQAQKQQEFRRPFDRRVVSAVAVGVGALFSIQGCVVGALLSLQDVKADAAICSLAVSLLTRTSQSGTTTEPANKCCSRLPVSSAASPSRPMDPCVQPRLLFFLIHLSSVLWSLSFHRLFFPLSTMGYDSNRLCTSGEDLGKAGHRTPPLTILHQPSSNAQCQLSISP